LVVEKQTVLVLPYFYKSTHGTSIDQTKLPFFYLFGCLKLAKQIASQRGIRPRPNNEAQKAKVYAMIDEATRALDVLA
jgi:hypothetical protein